MATGPRKNPEIKLFNPDTDVSTLIRLDNMTGVDDVTLVLTPTEEIMFSRARLDRYKANLSSFLSNPVFNNMINTPDITNLSVDGDDVSVDITTYNSSILLPYSCTSYQLSVSQNFDTIAVDRTEHKIDDHNKLNFNVSALTSGQDYYLRVRYGGGGYYSEWSQTRGISVTRPTLDAPVVNPIGETDYVYKDTAPYDVSITVNAVPMANPAQHGSTVWKVYEDVDGTRKQVWSSGKDTSNLNTITLSSMFPGTLQYNKKYLVSATYYGSDGSYSSESNFVELCASKIISNGVTNLSVYPDIVNISNPVLGFDETITVTINGKEKVIDYSNIDKIYWDISSGEFSSKHTSNGNTLQLPAGTLSPNTTYKIKVWYYHRQLGESKTSEIEVTTESQFVAYRDNLTQPIKTYDGMAFFGDIPTQRLMNSNVVYTGMFKERTAYKAYEEVNYNGELWICKRSTPATAYTFEDYFVKSDSKEASTIYQSGLPSFRWLVNNIGLNPYLCTNDMGSGLTNVLRGDDGAWLKCQNVQGKIIYITKFPIYNGISVNDLIKADLFHPRRKTIRIADSLYYVRLLATNINHGYDAIDPSKKGDTLNHDYGSIDVDYKEDKIITSLMNGKLYAFTTTDLDLVTNDYKELVYDSTRMCAYKGDNSNGLTYSSRDVVLPDERKYSFRLVLELIPDYERPIRHISSRIPGNMPVLLKDGIIEDYDPYLDGCYLGTVAVEDFLSSLAINEKSGLNSNKVVPNLQWHKFYYRGLIYFLSQGLNLQDENPNDIIDRNMIYPTPTYAIADGSVKPTSIKYGKVIYNGLIYNTTCPQVLNMDNQHVVIKNSAGLNHDILTPGTNNKSLTIAYNSFLSDMVYPIFANKVPTPSDNRQIPFDGAKGYKGLYKNNVSKTKLIDNLGSCDPGDYDSTFLTSQSFLSSTGATRYVLNSQRDIYTMAEYDNISRVNVIFCMTVNPTVDNYSLWGK